MKPRVLILRAAGTNCEHETAWAFDIAGAQAQISHINNLTKNTSYIDQFQAVVIPGGFSYGDDIASGKVFANQMHLYLRESLEKLIERKGLILGICNGFQVLIKTGLLGEGQSTLTHNSSGRYLDCWVHVKSHVNHCHFLKTNESYYLPIAHAEGKFTVKNNSDNTPLVDSPYLALKYDPINPNGSDLDVAGMTDKTGQILGLMPHPERHIRFEHHPHWTRLEKNGQQFGDGYKLFKNAVDYLKSI